MTTSSSDCTSQPASTKVTVYIDGSLAGGWPITSVGRERGFFAVDLGRDLAPKKNQLCNIQLSNFCIGGLEGANLGDTIYLLLEGVNLSILNQHLLPIIATWQPQSHSLVENSSGDRKKALVVSTTEEFKFPKYPIQRLAFTIRTLGKPVVLTEDFAVSFCLQFN